MLSGLSENARAAVLGIFGAAAAFFMFGGLQGASGAAVDPIDAVPRDAFLVATLNAAELRRSPIYETVFGKDGASPIVDGRALGIGRLADACGFDPLSRVETLALAVPEEGDKGELGVAAHVNVTRGELSQCTAALADRRGSKVETKDVGSFTVVEDASSETARARIGYGKGMLVAGRGAWFDAMLAAAERKKGKAPEATAHTAMRAALTGRDGWHTPTLVMTAILPRTLRDRIKNEMGAELGDAESGQSIMAGVLAVSTAGVALKAGGRGQNTDAAVELACDPQDGKTGEMACTSVEKLIQKKKFELSKELMLRMVGLGPLLDSIEVKRDGARIRVTASGASDTLASVLDRVLRLRGRGRPEGGHPSRGPARPSTEIIPAPKASE